MFNCQFDYEIYEKGLTFLEECKKGLSELGFEFRNEGECLDIFLRKFDLSDRQRVRIHTEVMHDYKYL